MFPLTARASILRWGAMAWSVRLSQPEPEA